MRKGLLAMVLSTLVTMGILSNDSRQQRGNQCMYLQRIRLVAWIALCLVVVGGTAEGKIVIEHLHNPVGGLPFLEATQAVAELFNAKQSDIEVKVTQSAGMYENTIITRILGGDPPDVINLIGYHYASYAYEGILADLGPYIQRDGLDLGEVFAPVAYQYFLFEGEQLGLPQSILPFVTFYNRHHFDEAGLVNPQALAANKQWTWEEIISLGKPLTYDSNADGVTDRYAIEFLGQQEDRVVLYAHQAGGSFFDVDVNPTKSLLTSPPVRQGVTFLHDLINVYRIAPPPSGFSYEYNMAGGNVSFTLEGVWQIIAFQETLKDAWDVAPLPHGPDNDAGMIHIDGVQMLSGIDHPEAAWEWIRFLTLDPEAVTIFTRVTERPPALLANLPDYFGLFRSEITRSLATAMLHTIEHPGSKPLFPPTPAYRELRDTFRPKMLEILGGEVAVEAGLEVLDQQWNRILADYHN
jgi:multiple sugar transport system substrate-binding protein